MSHGDRIDGIPGAEVIAKSANCPLAAVRVAGLNFHGVQFHPESILTEHGHAMLKNFLDLKL
jgi:GMP synthase-like glutamine amidotransferase